MAIDTAAKRASAMGFMQPWFKLVVPDGTVEQADRQTTGDLYGGILADVLAIVYATMTDEHLGMSMYAKLSSGM